MVESWSVTCSMSVLMGLPSTMTATNYTQTSKSAYCVTGAMLLHGWCGSTDRPTPWSQAFGRINLTSCELDLEGIVAKHKFIGAPAAGINRVLLHKAKYRSVEPKSRQDVPSIRRACRP